MSLGIVNPKKRREIEGVGSGSLLDLKATLFKAQEESKNQRLNPGSASGKLLVKAPLAKNKGVDSRSLRDEEELQKMADPTAILQEKVERYRSMARDGFRDEKEKFLVDFEQKKWDGAAADDNDGLELFPVAASQHHDVDEGVRKELGESLQDAGRQADALLAKRREAAKRRRLAAQSKPT